MITIITISVVAVELKNPLQEKKLDLNENKSYKYSNSVVDSSTHIWL